MRIDLHIGLDAAESARLQRVLASAREHLLSHGILFAASPGAGNHTRLFMAASDAGAVDALRMNRGFFTAESQNRLRDETSQALAREVETHAPDRLILSAHQLGTVLHRASELVRLRDMLAPLSADIHVHAHLAEPARALARRYGAQILDGRLRPLTLEMQHLLEPDFRAAALSTWPEPAPERALFAEAQGAAFWLDYPTLQRAWEAAFGAGRVHFHSLDPAALYGPDAAGLVARAFVLDADLGAAKPEKPPAPPSAAWLARCRRMNEVFLRHCARERTALPRPVWRKLLGEIKVKGDPIDPGSLKAVSQRFGPDLAALCAAHPGLDPAHLRPADPQPHWQEADPQKGFRATQYFMAFRWRINQAMKEAKETQARPEPDPADADAALSPAARAILPETAKKKFIELKRSRFAPHDRLGALDESAAGAPYFPASRPLPETGSGRIVVACMKNEAPYILEWIAYHRAIGFDGFLIYSNDCTDGTDAILDRLQAIGVVQHRDNSDWRGRSPQQHALDISLREPIVRDADWLAHIDVDEFVNVRCGNGTLDDLFERIGDANHVAMTWRLFGHNGVDRLSDRFVIEQFDHAAPKYCPKPHTAWGFKTLFRNIGAYERLSCHRPNRLRAGAADGVRWVNGAGRDMTREVLTAGWRNSKRSIGYDLVQLNHYALRSAESFLIKRQRGRALHVDRQIGLNYWIRMDWSDIRDVTIQRNLPRLRAEVDRLLEDNALRALHEAGLDWHRAKGRELRSSPEFGDLFSRALDLRLTPTERAAWALALDVES